MAIQILLTLFGLFVLWQIGTRVFRKLSPSPTPAFMGRFLDSPLRRFLQPPDELIRRSGIKKGMQVLEIGCGSGAFTTWAARAVGKEGKVYALDVQMGMLRQLQGKLLRPENQDIKNVSLIDASAYEMPFHDNSLDMVYMVTALPEIAGRHRALRETRRVLKPEGLLAVTEFLPDPDYPLRSTTIKLGQKAGFVLEEASGNFWNYTVRFVRPGQLDK